MSKLHAEFSKLYDQDALRKVMLGERTRVIGLHPWSRRTDLARIDGSYFFVHYDLEYRLNVYRTLIELSDADPDLRTREYEFWLYQLSRPWPEPRANWPRLLLYPNIEKQRGYDVLKGANRFISHDRELYATLLLIGMERYRLAKGELPDELDQLVPVFVERPPVNLVGEDPFDMTSDDEYIYITEKEKPALPDSPVKVEMRKKGPVETP